jgi:MFS family permease
LEFLEWLILPKYVIYYESAIVLGLNEGIILIMCLYLLYNFAAVILTYPAGLLYDKIGKHSIIIGFVLYIMTLLGFIFASNFWSLIIFFIIYGLSVAFIDGNARALISDISRQNVRGTALGTYYFVVGLVALPVVGLQVNFGKE